MTMAAHEHLWGRRTSEPDDAPKRCIWCDKPKPVEADARCGCEVIKRPHILRDHWVPDLP